MKLVITHSTTKRKITGPMNIIGSRDDLISLAKQITIHITLYEDENDTPWVYGGIDIYDPDDLPDPIINSKPLKWDE